MEELVKKQDVKKIEETDGFLKFVTESREWAFKYIEDVQSAIIKLKAEFEKITFDPGNYFLQEELEDLRNTIENVLGQLPEDSKND